eukprot:TRINITY_DN112185_c0_g1_i1.p1 TRINITY_DN112185_c0_g1~~TRINITY_DN112185_c0_g1_i1.p1  ORF type:complete len:310 (-),score=61.84 TRINITY_DN112185_c0_g1_i1:331-1260(-)
MLLIDALARRCLVLFFVLTDSIEALNLEKAVARHEVSPLAAPLAAVRDVVAFQRLPDNLKDLQKREEEASDSMLRSYGFEHVLRICNAYADSVGLEAFLTTQKLTISPMPYSHCQQYGPRLKVGDQVIFRVGDLNGTFTLSRLPAAGSVLLMVVSRHETENHILAFHSHVFAALKTPQIAVIDAYRGRVPSLLRKHDARIHIQADSPTGVRDEALQYNKVVVINPGRYRLQLRGEQGEGNLTALTDIVAVARGCYAVIRIGVSDTMYSPGILVFPKTEKRLLGAAVHGCGQAGMFLLLALLQLAWPVHV